MRVAQTSDLDAIVSLAQETGPGLTTFKPDRDALAARIARTHRTLDGLLDLARSRSYFITKDPDAQAAVIASLRRLHAEHPDLAGAETIELPYVTRCYRATLGA